MKTLALYVCTAILALAAPPAAHADLKTNFNKINSTYKGPFGANVLQGDRGRGEIRDGSGAVGKTQFQAAFRNDTARAMADQDNFWTGNLFTTNYYELMGEFVYGNRYGSHSLDHQRLLDAAAKAMPKASAMVRHWSLEKHFVFLFPNSQIGKSFTLRGIADVQNEQEYANYFFNFYLSAINDDYQYLPAFVLVNKSPIADSASISKARDLVAQVYDSYAAWGAGSPGVAEMYKVRNAIHNQLSKETITLIDKFIKAYPEYANDFRPIRQILVDYYGISAAKISTQAKKLNMPDLKAAADKVSNKATYLDGLLELSRSAAAWRADIATKIPFAQRAQAFALLADTAKVLNKEIGGMKAADVKNPKALEALVNTIYLEGFLIKDNWEYFQKEVATSTNPAQLLSDIVDASTATVSEAFGSALAQWVSVEPKMQSFMDSTIKGSALNTASATIEKLRK